MHTPTYITLKTVYDSGTPTHGIVLLTLLSVLNEKVKKGYLG